MQFSQLGQHELYKRSEVLARDKRAGESIYRILTDGGPLPHGRANDIDERCAILEPKGVGLGQRVAHGLVTTYRSLVGPQEDVAEELDTVELVDADQAIDVGLLRDIDEGQRHEVVPD